MVTFSAFTPRLMKNRAHAIAEAPAPLTATLRLERGFSCRNAALISAAPEMIAVPCWSSWNTGIFIRLRSCSSM